MTFDDEPPPEPRDGWLLVRVFVPELNVHKCLQFPSDKVVWDVKQQCLASLPKPRAASMQSAKNPGLGLWQAGWLGPGKAGTGREKRIEPRRSPVAQQPASQRVESRRSAYPPWSVSRPPIAQSVACADLADLSWT
uniref:Uncharacterized protein n=1 Tax=Anopheles albimanus TaxID=7167 RepID=A0A182FM16_ANOAL